MKKVSKREASLSKKRYIEGRGCFKLNKQRNNAFTHLFDASYHKIRMLEPFSFISDD
jgi:hypothetical protein